MTIAPPIEIYIRGTSPIHHWDGRWKVLSLLILMFAIALIRHLVLMPWVLAMVVLLYAAAQLPLTYLLRRLPYPGLFILAMVGLLPWISGETVIWQWHGLTLRLEGLQNALLIMGRFLAIVTTGFILLGTTPFLELVKALRTWGFPSLLADMTLLTYRYLYEIATQWATMQQAMQLRGYGSRGYSLRGYSLRGYGLQQRHSLQREWGWMVALFGSLLLRSYERSQRVYHAMGLRGYGQASQTDRYRIRKPSGSAVAITPVATSLTLLAAAGFILAEWILTRP